MAEERERGRGAWNTGNTQAHKKDIGCYKEEWELRP